MAFDAEIPLTDWCRRMLSAQAVYGPHGEALDVVGDAVVGRCLYSTLPEDSFDSGPIHSSVAALTLVADARLDNRDELLKELGREGSGASKICDAALILMAFERWRADVVHKLCGDFAFAVWDREERQLILARDPIGQRPLHFHVGDGWFAFASMPQGLLALPTIRKFCNEQLMAEFVAGLPRRGSASYFEGICRVEPGHLAVINRGGIETRKYWTPRGRQLRFAKSEDYVEAFQEQLARATRPRLRRAKGIVASHLSSGWDSSAVTATAAALLLPSERILALTAAPRLGFSDGVPPNFIADESYIASKVALLHKNIDHVVVRPDGASPLNLLAENDVTIGEPIGYICNGKWWAAINSAAAAKGTSVMLTGEFGNYTISAGGVMDLANLIRRGHWMRWWKEAHSMVRRGTVRWTGVLDNSIGPFVPLYDKFRSVFLNSPDLASEAQLLVPAWRVKMEDRLKQQGALGVAPRDTVRHRQQMIQLGDPGNFRKGSLAKWGIEERDPTADTRLIEFCLSLPSEALLNNGVRRPLARAALSDRLPVEVLDCQKRGYQMADWYEQLRKEDVEAAIRPQPNDPAAQVIDPNAARQTLADWPSGDWASLPVIERFRVNFMRAVSATSFLRTWGGRTSFS